MTLRERLGRIDVRRPAAVAESQRVPAGDNWPGQAAGDQAGHRRPHDGNCPGTPKAPAVPGRPVGRAPVPARARPPASLPPGRPEQGPLAGRQRSNRSFAAGSTQAHPAGNEHHDGGGHQDHVAVQPRVVARRRAGRQIKPGPAQRSPAIARPRQTWRIAKAPASGQPTQRPPLPAPLPAPRSR